MGRRQWVDYQRCDARRNERNQRYHPLRSIVRDLVRNNRAPSDWTIFDCPVRRLPRSEGGSVYQCFYPVLVKVYRGKDVEAWVERQKWYGLVDGAGYHKVYDRLYRWSERYHDYLCSSCAYQEDKLWEEELQMRDAEAVLCRTIPPQSCVRLDSTVITHCERRTGAPAWGSLTWDTAPFTPANSSTGTPEWPSTKWITTGSWLR